MEKHEEFKEFFEEVYNIERFKKEINHVLFTGSHVAEQVGKTNKPCLGYIKQ